MNNSSEQNIANVTQGLITYTSSVPAILEFVLGVFGNGLALVLLISSRHEHKWSLFFRFYCALAITDVLHLSVIYPVSMVRYASNFHWSIKSVPGLCDVVSFMMMWGIMSSGILIGIMSLERYITVFYYDAFDFRAQNSTWRKSLIAILCSWTFSAALASMPLFGLGHNDTFYPGTWCFVDFSCGEHDAEAKRLVRIAFFVYCFIGMGVYTITAYLNFSTICASFLRKGRLGLLLQNGQVPGESEFSIMFFLTAVFVLFSALWAPIMVDILIHSVNGDDGNQTSVDLLLLRLCIGNAIADPWIYIFSQKRMRQKIKNLLTCKRRSTSSEAIRLLDEQTGTK